MTLMKSMEGKSTCQHLAKKDLALRAPDTARMVSFSSLIFFQARPDRTGPLQWKETIISETVCMTWRTIDSSVTQGVGMNKHNSFLPGMLEDQGSVQQSKNFCDTATSKADQSFRHDPFFSQVFFWALALHLCSNHLRNLPASRQTIQGHECGPTCHRSATGTTLHQELWHHVRHADQNVPDQHVQTQSVQ